jgi:hypothetical protein
MKIMDAVSQFKQKKFNNDMTNERILNDAMDKILKIKQMVGLGYCGFEIKVMACQLVTLADDFMKCDAERIMLCANAPKEILAEAIDD